MAGVADLLDDDPPPRHHGGEIGALRDLYRVAGAGPEPTAG
jgi:hypothetical protein